jgi:hypothetical protein
VQFGRLVAAPGVGQQAHLYRGGHLFQDGHLGQVAVEIRPPGLAPSDGGRRPHELGDSVTHTDVPATFTNALPRAGPGLPVRLKTEGIVTHRTRNTPGCASAVLLDVGGSMRYVPPAGR